MSFFLIKKNVKEFLNDWKNERKKGELLFKKSRDEQQKLDQIDKDFNLINDFFLIDSIRIARKFSLHFKEFK